MFKKISFITLSLLAFATYGFTEDSTTTQKVSDKTGRYSIEFPLTWKASNGEDLGVDVIVTAPSARIGLNFTENANVISQELDQPMTTQQYFDQALPELKKFDGFKLSQTKEITINGLKGLEIEYSYMLKDQEIKVLQYVVVKDKLVVVVSFGADPEDYPTMKNLYETIALTLVIK